jgi:hypothetical protein
MPQRSKSRRTASRQTQLGQRKKRQQRGPSGIPTVPPVPEVEEAKNGTPPPAENRPDAVRLEPAAAQRPSPGRQAAPQPRVYNYVRPEIRRIFGFAAVVLVVLIALSFVLN